MVNNTKKKIKLNGTMILYSPPTIPIINPSVAITIGRFTIFTPVCSHYFKILLPITNLSGYLCPFELISVITTPAPGSDA